MLVFTVPLFSREDYDAMAGQLASSMEAEAPSPDDVGETSIYEHQQLLE